jgi:PII-like signaling protein
MIAKEKIVKGIHLRFYTYENHRHGSSLLYEWLLEFARQRGIPGGSAFRAIAGFGRHGRLHEQHFFELAGDVPVLVEFIAAEFEADSLIAALHEENVHLFYARLVTDFEVIEPAASED